MQLAAATPGAPSERPATAATRPPSSPLSTPRREVARPRLRVSSSKRRSSIVGVSHPATNRRIRVSASSTTSGRPTVDFAEAGLGMPDLVRSCAVIRWRRRTAARAGCWIRQPTAGARHLWTFTLTGCEVERLHARTDLAHALPATADEITAALGPILRWHALPAFGITLLACIAFQR